MSCMCDKCERTTFVTGLHPREVKEVGQANAQPVGGEKDIQGICVNGARIWVEPN